MGVKEWEGESSVVNGKTNTNDNRCKATRSLADLPRYMKPKVQKKRTGGRYMGK